MVLEVGIGKDDIHDNGKSRYKEGKHENMIKVLNVMMIMMVTFGKLKVGRVGKDDLGKDRKI